MAEKLCIATVCDKCGLVMVNYPYCIGFRIDDKDLCQECAAKYLNEGVHHMWTNPTTAAKCPRGDCIHYATAPDVAPCRDCTCNRGSDAPARAFRYESKIKREEAKP